jgi:hypothetical protein
MKEQFVSFEIAKSLKDLGFNEPCLAYYQLSFEEEKEPFTSTELNYFRERYDNNNFRLERHPSAGKQAICTAPLWQQAFDFIESKYAIGLHPYPVYRGEKIGFYKVMVSKYNENISDDFFEILKDGFDTLYEAREKSLIRALKMIDEKEFKKGGDLKDNSKNKNMSGENEFVEIADYGDQMYFKRDFGQVIVGDDEKEIPLVLVATIENFYEATGDDRFEEKPFIISLSIYPSIEFIDKAHIESCADSAGINADEVGYTDLVSYGLGIPLNLKNLEEGYAEMNDAEEFLKSKELKDQLNSQQMMVGWYMDGAINRAGDSRWAYLEHSLDKSKSWN